MSTNPYEVTPRIWNEWHELLKEKLRCEATKEFALEIGRLGIILGCCMIFAAFMASIDPAADWQNALGRLAWAMGLIVVGLAISYPMYKPVRMRLNEIELILPTAKELEPEEVADDEVSQLEDADDEARPRIRNAEHQ